MPEIHEVLAIVANPSSADPHGRVTVGFYTLADGLLTMTTSDGVPVRNFNNGEKITHRIASGEVAADVAKRLTLKIFNMARGETVAGFNRTISYQKWGVA